MRFYDAKALLSEGKEQNSRQRAQHCKLAKFKELEQDGTSPGHKGPRKRGTSGPTVEHGKCLAFSEGHQD